MKRVLVTGLLVLLVLLTACEQVAQDPTLQTLEDPIEVFIDPSVFDTPPADLSTQAASDGTTFYQANRGAGSPTMRYPAGQLIAHVTNTTSFNRFLADHNATVLATNTTVAPPSEVTKTRPAITDVYKLISVNTSRIPSTTTAKMQQYITQAENRQAQFEPQSISTQAADPNAGSNDVYFDSQNSLNLAALAISVNTGERSYPGVEFETNTVLEFDNLNALEQKKSSTAYHNVGEDFWWLKSGGLNVVTKTGSNSWTGAWTRTKPGTSTKLTGDGVTIAVIDTGFLKSNYDFSGYDPVQKRYETKRYVTGYDFPNRDYDPTTKYANSSTCANSSSCFHGTYTATVAAGIHDNHYGISGVAPDANLLLFNTANTTSLYIGWSGMYNAGWAVDTANHWGADIINMSFSAFTPFAWGIPFTYLGRALKRSYNDGVVNVASYGNNGWSIPHNTLKPIPGAWSTVIGVGASTSSGSRASFSNYGVGIDLFAPGVNISKTLTPAECSNYFLSNYCSNVTLLNTTNGTSFSSPAVAGVIALMKQKKSSLTMGQSLGILQTSARTSSDSKISKRLVNALAAVDAVK